VKLRGVHSSIKRLAGFSIVNKMGSKYVVIENSSSYPLEYVNCGTVSGYSTKPVCDMFEEKSGVRVIPPNRTATLNYRYHFGGAIGKAYANIYSLGLASIAEQCDVLAYISLRVRTPRKNHIVALGFSQGGNRCNKAGVQIRAEDGVLDDRGQITGHGTDPTGNVTNIEELALSVPFAESFKKDGISWHEFNEECRALKIRCQQDNRSNGEVRFKFMDGGF